MLEFRDTIFGESTRKYTDRARISGEHQIKFKHGLTSEKRNFSCKKKRGQKFLELNATNERNLPHNRQIVYFPIFKRL